MEKDITTDELLARLFKATQLKDVLENEDITQPPLFDEYLRQLCRGKGEIAEHVIKRAGIDRTYGHQLFSAEEPSRDKRSSLPSLWTECEKPRNYSKLPRKQRPVPKNQTRRRDHLLPCPKYGDCRAQTCWPTVILRHWALNRAMFTMGGVKAYLNPPLMPG
jgi:hypothetical protein